VVFIFENLELSDKKIDGIFLDWIEDKKIPCLLQNGNKFRERNFAQRADLGILTDFLLTAAGSQSLRKRP
jgi:hypothetical protein